MGWPFRRHIDDAELHALAPLPFDAARGLRRLSPAAIREAEAHVRLCHDCRERVEKYSELVNRSANIAVSFPALPGPDCPLEADVDWVEVAGGLWPELKAAELILHAAQCAHCGPLLRASLSVSDDPTPREEQMLARLKAPSRPPVQGTQQPIMPRRGSSSARRSFLGWKILATAAVLVVTVGAMVIRRASSMPLSGANFAEIAVVTHRQHIQGNLALDVLTDSQQAINGWLQAKSPFSVALPGSPMMPGEERPYRLEGARLVQIGGKAAAYIAYKMQTGPVSLMVTPDSVAVASGGVEAEFKKVTFHYRSLSGYKVVTWEAHGLSYALVSQEGSGTQRSCMVCHSAMRDRDLTHTPTPLRTENIAIASLLK